MLVPVVLHNILVHRPGNLTIQARFSNMMSNFPLPTVSEDIEAINEFADTTETENEPPSRRKRGSARSKHTKAAKRLCRAIRIGDTFDIVQLHRTMMVRNFEIVEQLYTEVEKMVGEVRETVTAETVWLQELKLIRTLY